MFISKKNLLHLWQTFLPQTLISILLNCLNFEIQYYNINYAQGISEQ